MFSINFTWLKNCCIQVEVFRHSKSLIIHNKKIYEIVYTNYNFYYFCFIAFASQLNETIRVSKKINPLIMIWTKKKKNQSSMRICNQRGNLRILKLKTYPSKKMAQCLIIQEYVSYIPQLMFLNISMYPN